MPAQLSGILLVAVFALVAVAGTVLAWRLIALSAPSGRRPVARPPAARPPAGRPPAGRPPAVPAPAPAEPPARL